MSFSNVLWLKTSEKIFKIWTILEFKRVGVSKIDHQNWNFPFSPDRWDRKVRFLLSDVAKQGGLKCPDPQNFPLPGAKIQQKPSFLSVSEQIGATFFFGLRPKKNVAKQGGLVAKGGLVARITTDSLSYPGKSLLSTPDNGNSLSPREMSSFSAWHREQSFLHHEISSFSAMRP